MEKVKEFLKLGYADGNSLDALSHRETSDSSFYENFSLRGIRVDRVEPGLVTCSFKVPPRLTDGNGRFANGAIANLVDELGGALVQVDGIHMNVSIDMSISFFSHAIAGDEIEITGKLLGRMGWYAGTNVILRNKATGELIAEGRHSLFGKKLSKI